MTTVKEFREWLNECCADDMDYSLAVDDGGLAVVLLDEDGIETGAKFEIGGTPVRFCCDCGMELADGVETMVRNHGQLSHLDPCTHYVTGE